MVYHNLTVGHITQQEKHNSLDEKLMFYIKVNRADSELDQFI